MSLDVKKILVPINGHKAGEDAFRVACELARHSKAKLYALYVIEITHELPIDAEVDPDEGEAILSGIETVSHEEKCHVEARYLQARRAGPAIVQEVEERRAELIVLGLPYKRHLGQFTLGDTASHVMKNAPCPVILWREGARIMSLAVS